MGRTPEKAVKDKVVAQLKKLGAYYFYPFSAGYSNAGVPDIVVCHKGRFIGIECKAGKNKPTKLQELNLKQIADAGGIALVINEENVNDVTNILGDTDDNNDTI
jgi:Holliday junction resolvase